MSHRFAESSSCRSVRHVRGLRGNHRPEGWSPQARGFQWLGKPAARGAKGHVRQVLVAPIDTFAQGAAWERTMEKRQHMKMWSAMVALGGSPRDQGVPRGPPGSRLRSVRKHASSATARSLSASPRSPLRSSCSRAFPSLLLSCNHRHLLLLVVAGVSETRRASSFTPHACSPPGVAPLAGVLHPRAGPRHGMHHKCADTIAWEPARPPPREQDGERRGFCMSRSRPTDPRRPDAETPSSSHSVSPSSLIVISHGSC